MDSTAANYLYWREHGAEWHAEYDQRKKLQVCYHCQQIMIAEYLRQCTPARVLEFGCGVGRHLRYLNAIPGIEVHGYDQSPAMVAGMQAWAEPDWLEARVCTGPAVGKLPYPEGAFDVVFTAEVLVHVRPEHLASILAELIRVARWQIIHFETSPDYPLDANAHDGCWYHDLCWAYGEKGLSCETLPAGYHVHRPYRVVLDASRPVPEATHVLPMLLRGLETDVQGTLDGWSAVGHRVQQLAMVGEQASAAGKQQRDPVALASKHCDLLSARIHTELEAKTRAEQANASLLAEVAAERSQRVALSEELAAERNNNAALHEELATERSDKTALCEELAAERSDKAALCEELAAERNKRAALDGELSCSQAQNANLLSESNQVRADLARLESSLGHRVLRRLRRMPGFPLLRSALHATLAGRCAIRSSSVATPVPLPGSAPIVPAPRPTPWEFVHANPAIPVVSICHPGWQGVLYAAQGHTPNLLLTPEISPSEIDAIVDSLVRSGATHFISEGFFTGYAKLLARLRQRMPAARIFCVMHGSFYQMIHNAEVPGVLRQLNSMRREGILDRVGFCKRGMAKAMERLGFPAFEVMNRMPGPATLLPRVWRSPARVFIPVGAQSRKNPHTQLIAALLAEDIGEVHLATPLDLQYLPADAMKGVRVKMHGTLNRAQTWQLIDQSDLVLNVTISECAPMVPLESLAVGVPCLTGANHGLFDDFPELVRLLVVSREDDAWAIAEAMDTVHREYKLCCDLIRQFNVHYDRKAAKSMADFLELEVEAYNPSPAALKAA